MVVASKIDEKTLKKEGVCAASLPTTMGVVAGFLVQNTLKYLLRFGTVSHYLGYNALEDFFPTFSLKPNKNCDDSFCVKQQQIYIEKHKDDIVEDKVQEDNVVHEDNEWGISVVDETVDEDGDGDNLEVTTGLKYSYTVPETSQQDPESQVQTTDVSLEELMKQMKSL